VAAIIGGGENVTLYRSGDIGSDASINGV